MPQIPRDPEKSGNRLNKTAIFKLRNKNFGTWKAVKQVYPDNDAVLYAIFAARYSKTPHGCPVCSRPYSTFTLVSKKLAFRCRCNYKVSPLKGTHFEQSRTDLVEILELIYDLFSEKNGVPASLEGRTIESHEETCWNNMHRIGDWMGWCNNKSHFTYGSVIEIDEVYPKAYTGLGPYFKYKRGAGSERTIGVLVLVERDNPETGLKGICKAFVFDKTDKKAVERIIKANVPIENQHTIHTDDHHYYEKLKSIGYTYHHVVKHSKKEFANKENPLIHTNTVEGFNTFVKTSIHRTHRGVWPKYLQLYINRITFNMSNRSKSFFDAFQTLLNSLPGLDECVDRKFKLKKRKRGTAFNQAA